MSSSGQTEGEYIKAEMVKVMGQGLGLKEKKIGVKAGKHKVIAFY